MVPNGRTRYSGLESTFRILQGIHITNACTIYQKPLWIRIKLYFLSVLNQYKSKSLKNVYILWNYKSRFIWRKPYFFDVLLHFILKVVLLCYFKYKKKTWRKCQKLSPFQIHNFALKRFNWDSTKFLGPLCHI